MIEGVAGRPPALLIAGPTASGKSALALRVARRLGGIVINADSMQVYRDLRILTARPSDEDERSAPHALFGMIDGNTPYSVSHWLADVALELDRARAAGRMPIVVGGTGLYFKALTQGLSEIPPVPDDVRSEVRAWAAGRPARDLHAALLACDPTTAGCLRPTDPQRLVRALEVHRATGRSLAEWQRRRGPPLLGPGSYRAIRLTPIRNELRKRADARFDAMVTDGVLDEVERLAARGVDPSLPVMRAHGVAPLIRGLRHEITLAAAIEEAKADTRRYIKRQDTFARHQLPDFSPVIPERADEMLPDYS